MQKIISKNIFNSLQRIVLKGEIRTALRYIHGGFDYWEATNGHIIIRVDAIDERDKMGTGDHIFLDPQEFRFKKHEQDLMVINTSTCFAGAFLNQKGRQTRRITLKFEPGFKKAESYPNTAKHMHKFANNHVPDFMFGVDVLQDLISAVRNAGGRHIEFSELINNYKESGLKGDYRFVIRVKDIYSSKKEGIADATDMRGVLMPISFCNYDSTAAERKKEGLKIHGIQSVEEVKERTWYNKFLGVKK